MVVVDHEVGGQPIVHKRIQILEDDLDAVPSLFDHHFLGDEDAVIAVAHILHLHLLPIHHHVLDPASIVVDPEMLLSIHDAVQPKRDIDNALIRVSLHQAQDQPIRDVLNILKIGYRVVGQPIPLRILHQHPT